MKKLALTGLAALLFSGCMVYENLTIKEARQIIKSPEKAIKKYHNLQEGDSYSQLHYNEEDPDKYLLFSIHRKNGTRELIRYIDALKNSNGEKYKPGEPLDNKIDTKSIIRFPKIPNIFITPPQPKIEPPKKHKQKGIMSV